MDRNLLRITKDNFRYLVREEISEHYVSLTYAIPRKTKKGYLGMKHYNIEHKMKDKEKALRIFENWKEDFVLKFYKKEIIRLFISYSPIIRYYVTCPKCHQNAEILSSMVMMGTGIGEIHYIFCEHCNPIPSDYAWRNVVGECEVILFGKQKEDKDIQLQINNSGIKYEEWIKR